MAVDVPGDWCGRAALEESGLGKLVALVLRDDAGHLPLTVRENPGRHDQFVRGLAVQADACVLSAPSDRRWFALEVLDCFLRVHAAWAVEDYAPPACGCAVEAAVGGKGFGGVDVGRGAGDEQRLATVRGDDCG